MKHSSLLMIATLTATLMLGGCSNRSIGHSLDDKFIGPRVEEKIQEAHPDLGSTSSHIVVITYNGATLLAGQTPSNELKQLAGKAASSVQGVSKIYNELQILPPTSLLARSNDSLLTTKIKTQMLADRSVPGSKIKVVTENGIVYLMGLITRREADRAVNLVQGVSGVQRIVKLFQYTD